MHKSEEAAYAAFVGIDWADKKHDICLWLPRQAKPERLVLEHRPEAIHAWARLSRCRTRSSRMTSASVGSSLARLGRNAERQRATVVGWTGKSTKMSCSSSAQTMGPSWSSTLTATAAPSKRARNCSNGYASCIDAGSIARHTTSRATSWRCRSAERRCSSTPPSTPPDFCSGPPQGVSWAATRHGSVGVSTSQRKRCRKSLKQSSQTQW